jgi:putative N-acetyltransferase (TIGR04045 family)
VIIEDALIESPQAFVPCEFRVKWADSAWEIASSRALRRAVFCVEQGIFVGDDVDAVDARAQTLVAVSTLAGMPDQVVGTVRIHAAADDDAAASGVWWGSRLAVHAAFRHHGRIGTTLVQLAVRSAHARGCRVFLAHVQAQNVPLFRKLRWSLLREESVHRRPHALMQAELQAYPPCHDPITGIVTRSAA